VRRALPEDFPEVYRLVDQVWERQRPDAAYDWLYLKNPCGIARGTLVIERSSAAIISVTFGFPWPVAEGDERRRATFGGDNVTIQRLQRTGLSTIRRAMGELHPWRDDNIGLGAPNAASRAKGVKLGDKAPLGPLPNATLVLDYQAYLQYRGMPKAVAVPVGRMANLAAAGWRETTLRGPSIRVETIDRFDSRADAVTERCMRSPDFWCPHDADFLNWRYFEHVLHHYQALAVMEGDEMIAYAVFRVDDGGGMLMEFAVETDDVARPLLAAVLSHARAAGCNRISFYATSGWRYWPLLRRAGFLARPSERYIDAVCHTRDDVTDEKKWQLLPGDSDVT
jgi:hypothetical protein